MNEYETKLKEVVKGRVVVYIDAANLERSVKSMFVRPDDISENLQVNQKAKGSGQSPEPRS